MDLTSDLANAKIVACNCVGRTRAQLERGSRVGNVHVKRTSKHKPCNDVATQYTPRRLDIGPRKCQDGCVQTVWEGLERKRGNM
eukprot:4556367-Amphidinium_carterae.2